MPNAKDMKRNPGSTREGCGDILGEDGCKKAGKPYTKLDFLFIFGKTKLVGCGMFPMVGLDLPECTTGNPNLNLDLPADLPASGRG